MGAWTKEPESLLPTAQPSREDVVFFAGFYEGEGSACGMKNGKSCVVQVPQKDPEMLYRARSLWGGSIRVNSRGISVWVMSGDRARKFLIVIYPLLSTRRKEQIERAGGLVLSGNRSLNQTGMSAERAALRANMTEEERRKETNRYSARVNYPNRRDQILAKAKGQNGKRNEYQRAYRARKKALNSDYLGDKVISNPERSQLLN